MDEKKSKEQTETMDAEFKRLRGENARLRTMLGIPDSGFASQPEAPRPDLRRSGSDLTTPGGKIALFWDRSLWLDSRRRLLFTVFAKSGRNRACLALEGANVD